MSGMNLYAIFWVPAKLQPGQPTTLTAKHESVAKQMLADYPYHGIANNSTQYYSTKNGVNTARPAQLQLTIAPGSSYRNGCCIIPAARLRIITPSIKIFR